MSKPIDFEGFGIGKTLDEQMARAESSGPGKAEFLNYAEHRSGAASSNIHLRFKLEELLDIRQNRGHRRQFASKIYHVVIFWLVCLIGILLLQGFRDIFSMQFFLPDTVLVALVGGASVNIIGTMAIVMRYLFPAPRGK